MKPIKLLSLLLLALLFTFSSCGDDDEDPKPQTKKELLTAETWKMSKIKWDGIDVTNEPEMAETKNSRTTFNSNGTYTQISSGVNESGVWEFSNNETVLLFDPNTADEEEWDITELKDNSLKMRSTLIVEDENGDIETILFELELVHAE